MAAIKEHRGKKGTTYRVQVRLRGHAPQTASFKRKTDARRWAAATESAILEGRHFPMQAAKRHTVADLIERRLAYVGLKKPHRLVKTRLQLGWWKEQLGPVALANVTAELLAKKRDELGAENIGTAEQPKYRTPATINRYLAALGKALTEAVKEYHWLHDNPMRRVTKETEPKGRKRFLTDDERKRLLDACAQSELKELSLIVLLALSTGARRGEILGLRWSEVDLKRRQISLLDTKNGDSRGVPILPQVAELLEAHGKIRRVDTDLLFPVKGKRVPIDPSKPFRAALEKAKIENFRFHDLRHTTASYMAMSHATLAEIAAVLGHKTLAMVQRYSHQTDQHTSSVLERMGAKFLGGGAA